MLRCGITQLFMQVGFISMTILNSFKNKFVFIKLYFGFMSKFSFDDY